MNSAELITDLQYQAVVRILGSLAGFFLFAVQPFKLGDHISVSYTSPAAASSASRSAWFEGTCEKVDLRYVPCHPFQNETNNPEFKHD